MRELAQKFMALFSGAEHGYGLYDVTGTKDASGKRVGNAVTKHDTVTVELWERHLSGRTGIGIIPIREDSTCWWGAIDLDVYANFDHKKMAQTLQKQKLPLIPCRSKSGGCHLYCFFKETIDADTVQTKLAEIAAFLGYGGSEIFPKQKKILVERGDKGSWINMPYFNGVRDLRYAVKIDGEAMSPDEFLQYAETLKVSREDFEQPLIKQQEDLIDGPPCLQHLIQIGGISEGARNNGLFNMAVYLRKAHPDSWEDKLEEYNHKYIDPPLKSVEIQGVIKSAKKRDYAFTCSKPPIAPHCNSAVCRTRKFGISDGSGQSFPNLGPLSKLDVKPPIWFWDVEGRRIELTTPELQDPNVFQRKCMEVLNMMPPVPSKIVWHRIVQTAMENVSVIEASEDASPEGQFFEHLDKFLSGKAKALGIEEIIQGKPFEDEEYVYFRLVDLEKHLDSVRFREFKTAKIASLIRDRGAKHQFDNFKGKGTNYWRMPKSKIGQQTEQLEVPDSVKQGEEAF
jgi:Primase C terminal 1 (PriCT-1)